MKHRPETARKNADGNHRGCLVLFVSQSADIYRRIEGVRCGIVGASNPNREDRMPGLS